MSGPRKLKRSEVRDEALSALDRSIERRKRSPLYSLSLMLVSVLVVALPLVYIAIVVGAGWGVYWYAGYGPGLMAGVQYGWGYLLGRFGPLAVGGVLFFFLLKPLLARPSEREKPFSLDPRAEPFLFEFVRHLSKRLGAPMPRRIDVDLRVNASASFSNGLRNIIDGKLALTIGLPLVSTLRLRELTAVLAHEFGHLSQGAGMRFYYLTQTVNLWFARVVFGRDAWDLRLERWAQGGLWISVLVLNVARACVWLSRRILHLLLTIAAAASSLMSRQMEFDADQNAIRLCGSESFARSMRKLSEIEVAAERATALNGQAWYQGRLVDDHPLLVRTVFGEITDEMREGILAGAMESTVDMYATHPPTGERIARSEALGLEGVFAVGAPASILFQDYPALCQELTRHRYQAALGAELDPSCFVPAAEVHSEGMERQRTVQATQEYFLGVSLGPGTLGLAALEPHPPDRPKRVLERLANVRRELVLAAQGLDQDEKQALQAELVRATAAKDLLTRRLHVRDPAFVEASKQRASVAADSARKGIEEDLQSLAPLAALMRTRIGLTLDLMCVPQVLARVEDGEGHLERASRAVGTLASLPPVSGEMFELGRRMSVIEVILPQLSEQDPAAVDRLIAAQARQLRLHLLKVRDKAAGLLSPYEHTRTEDLLADYLVPELPADERGFQVLVEVAKRALVVWTQLLYSLLGDVSTAGLKAERGMNLEPLRDVEE